MKEAIREAAHRGDTLGGVFEVVATGVPAGLGSHAQWDRKLDGRLAQALMSIPAIKAVEVGEGFAAARRAGSEVHDAIGYDHEGRRFTRPTNRAGGVEGGITNGEPVVCRAVMKPIATLRHAAPERGRRHEGDAPRRARTERRLRGRRRVGGRRGDGRASPWPTRRSRSSAATRCGSFSGTRDGFADQVREY